MKVGVPIASAPPAPLAQPPLIDVQQAKKFYLHLNILDNHLVGVYILSVANHACKIKLAIDEHTYFP